MYRLRDQVRDVALGYADIHLQQRRQSQARPRAICEFDGQKWTPVELMDEDQLDTIQPRLQSISLRSKDSAYSSNVSSQGRHSPPPEPSSELMYPTSPDEIAPEHTERSTTSYMQPINNFRRSSEFQIPAFDAIEQFDNTSDMPEELAELEDSAEAQDILRELLVQQRSGSVSVDGKRRPSILASSTYQRNLINFSAMQVSEVDLSEGARDCDLELARQHIITAFPKQFAAELTSKEPLTSFSVYSDSQDYVEMLHIVLVLETRSVFWKLLGPTDKPVDQVTTLPYSWAADLDVPPLSLDEPKVTNEVECIVMGNPTFSTILCDNHNDECRKCKGLASQDDCFACDGSGVFKKKPCVMCSGRGQYFCKTCHNSSHVACQLCGGKDQPQRLLRQAYITCTRETVVSPTMEVEGDDKFSLIATAKALAKKTVEEERFMDSTLPVAACGVVIRQRGHVVCATDIKTGARGLFEVISELDRVEFKGQLPPVPKTSSRPSSIRSTASRESQRSKSSWFNKKKVQQDQDDDDAASIRSTRSTASTRVKNLFKRK